MLGHLAKADPACAEESVVGRGKEARQDFTATKPSTRFNVAGAMSAVPGRSACSKG